MLQAVETIKELGALKFGRPHRFNFLVENKGERPVEFKLQVGCTSCTKASTTSNIINPASQMPINVVFTPGSTGLQKKNLSVVYDDSVLKLEFTANVYA